MPSSKPADSRNFKSFTTSAVFAILVAFLLALGFMYLMNRRKEGFENSTMSSLVLYFAPWCGHCKAFLPEFEKFEAEVKASGLPIQVKKVNGDEHPEAVKEKEVKGFPTVLLEKVDGTTVEYDGARDAKALLAFIKEKLNMA